MDASTGEIQQAQVFVGVMGGSNQTHVEATWTQSLPDWTWGPISLATYNAGPGNVTLQGMKAYIPETQEYVAKVMRHYSSYRSGMASMSNITINNR